MLFLFSSPAFLALFPPFHQVAYSLCSQSFYVNRRSAVAAFARLCVRTSMHWIHKRKERLRNAWTAVASHGFWCLDRSPDAAMGPTASFEHTTGVYPGNGGLGSNTSSGQPEHGPPEWGRQGVWTE